MTRSFRRLGTRRTGVGEARLSFVWLLVVAALVVGLAADTLFLTLVAVLLAVPAAIATAARWHGGRRVPGGRG